MKTNFIFITNNMHNEILAGQESIRIWRCSGCDGFHVRAGKALLSFTGKQFAEFSEAIIGCLADEVRPLELHETEIQNFYYNN